MTKLNFQDIINFFWNREDFAVTAFQFSARIYKKVNDEIGDPYYLLDFYVTKMLHMKKGYMVDGSTAFVKMFSFDLCDIESIEHLVDVCKNTFDQLVVEEIRYLKQEMDKMNKLLID